MKSKITITAVGDISLGDYNMSLGFGVKSVTDKIGSAFLFEELAGELSKGDIIFGNLETVLSDTGIVSEDFSSLVMRGRPQSIKALISGGFNVVNIANNHSMQHGHAAFVETCNLLRENGIKPVGLKGKWPYSSAPVIQNVENKAVGILGYSFCRDPYAGDMCPYARGKIEDIRADIHLLKKRVHLTIISCHWGFELLSHPSREMVDMAHAMVDSGADIIIGHHPHVIQGVERYAGKLIFYSLGNCIFDSPYPACMQSYIAHIEVLEDAIDYSTIPFIVGKSYQPKLAYGKEKSHILEYVVKMSRELQTPLFNFYDKARCLSEYEILRRKERVWLLFNLVMHIKYVKSKYLVALCVNKCKTYLQ